MTPRWFEAFVRSRLGDPSLSYRQWRERYPGNTHISLVYVNGSKHPRVKGIGTLEELRPKPENPAWVRKVTRFGKRR